MLFFACIFLYGQDSCSVSMDGFTLSRPEKELLKAAAGKRTAYSLWQHYMTVCRLTNSKKHAALSRKHMTFVKRIKALVPDGNDYATARRLCELMHRELLEQYDFNAVFPGPLLQKGVYNCVSSAFLYADLLKRYGIAFQFACVQDHTLIYVLINGKKIQTETTSVAGFDAGKYVITNEDGSWTKSTAKAYRGAVYKNEQEMLAVMCHDKRIHDLLAAAGVRENYKVTREGWLLDNKNSILQENLISYAVQYLNTAQLADKTRRKILLENLCIFSNRKQYIPQFISAGSDIVYGYYIDNDKKKIKELLQAVEQTAAPVAEPVIEGIYVNLSSRLLGQAAYADVDKVCAEGLARFPGNDALSNNRKSASILQADTYKDMNRILARYRMLFKENKEDMQVINSFILKVEPFFRAVLKKGDTKKTLIWLKQVTAAGGSSLRRRLINYVYVNLVYELNQNREFQKALGTAVAVFQLDFFPKLAQNYLAVLSGFSEKLYLEQGFRKMLLTLSNELQKLPLEKFPGYQKIPQQLQKTVTGFLVKEVKAGNFENVSAAQKVFTFQDAEHRQTALLDTIYINAVYELIKEKAYSRAVLTAEQVLSKKSSKKFINNYVYALRQYAGRRLLQKDTSGTAALLREKINKYPFVSELKTLLFEVYRDTLVELIINGQLTEANRIINSFAGYFDNAYMQKQKAALYTEASYSLLQNKAFFPAYKAAAFGLQQVFNDKLFRNFNAALYRYARQQRFPKAISLYKEQFKLYKDKAGLRESFTALLSPMLLTNLQNQAWNKTETHIKLHRSLAGKELNKKLCANVFTRSSYIALTAGDLQKALNICELGSRYTESAKFKNNYIVALRRYIKQQVTAGNTAPAQKRLTTAGKLLPENKAVAGLQQLLQGKSQ